MSAPLVGQDKGPLATVARDYLEARQEWEFPRGRVNKKLFFDEEWEINKPSFAEQNLKFDCCNIQTGGQRNSIDCAFKRVYEAIPMRGDFIGAPHGGTTGHHRLRENGFITRRVTGKR